MLILEYTKIMFRAKIQKLLKEITGREARVEQPADPKNGGYSTNVAMAAKMDAEKIAEQLRQNPLFENVEARNGVKKWQEMGSATRNGVSHNL